MDTLDRRDLTAALDGLDAANRRIAELETLVHKLAERVHSQSEKLSRRAERRSIQWPLPVETPDPILRHMDSSPDETALVAALRCGDGAAYETVVRTCGGPMLAVAGRILRNDEVARDAVQDAFLSAFRGLDRFDGRSKLLTWLHRVTLNAALMKLRSRRRKPERSIEDLLPHFTDDEHQVNPPAPWPEQAVDIVQRAELRATVRGCIDQLPAAYRTVLLLRDIEGLDTDETARLIGANTAVVKTRLHRARQALRTLLEPHLRDV